MVLFLSTEKYLNAQKNCETATMQCKVSKYQRIKVFFGSFSAQSEWNRMGPKQWHSPWVGGPKTYRVCRSTMCRSGDRAFQNANII